MTKYEFLKVNQSLLTAVAEKGITTKDVKLLPLYDDYVELSKQDLKGFYIIVHLAEKYNISTRTVYKVLERMRSVITI